MIKTRDELFEELVPNIKLIKKKRRVVDEIKLHLAKEYGILAGTIQEVINNPLENLPKLETRELYLVTEQIFSKTGDIHLNPDLFFTDVEKREAHLYEAGLNRKSFDLPLTLENATIVGNSAYALTIDIKILDMMLNSQNLHYDPELQREMKIVNDKKGIRYEPTVVKKNVDEIAEHMLNGTLVPTTLVWNAMLGSGDDGEELIYDAKTMTLTITKGTKLAIVDGFHRHKGSQMALRQNSELDFNFILLITNYSKTSAQKYQAQLAEATPISKNRKIQLKSERYSDGIVTRLMQESDMKDKISQDFKLKTTASQLVSYNVLADSIDSYFDIVSKKDSKLVGDFLIEFFDELIGSYSKEFITDVKETKKVSLINHNNMFVGYIVIASKMYKKDIAVNNVTAILNNIDFNKSNKLWIDLGVLNEKGSMEDTSKVRKAISNYFIQLDIN